MQEPYKVLTPALEGSKSVQPVSGRMSMDGYNQFQPFPRMGDPGPPGLGRGGYYPGVLPPIGGMGGGYMNVMPGERYPMQGMMPRPRYPRYMGPPSLMPQWGGYSMQGNYFPERPRMPNVMPQRGPSPMISQPPPPPRVNIIPIPIRAHRQKALPQIYQGRPSSPPKKSVKKTKSHTFSGQKALRRFRQVVIAVAFIALLKTNLRKTLTNRPSSMFLFGIILKEIVAALHRIYLNPSGNIYPVLNDIIGPNCYDLAQLVSGGRMGEREEAVLVQELQYVIENLIYHITEIMPSTGVLGTHRKSAVFELIRSGKRFPDGYFWQVEIERLQFSEQGRTSNVGDTEGFLLMLGIFISRSLITTILMKPIDYGLSSTPLTEVAERNLRIVASAMLYLVRRIAVSRARGIMGMPQEISRYLYDDDEMKTVYSRLSRTFNYCEGLLREWGTEYIRRLRASSMQ